MQDFPQLQSLIHAYFHQDYEFDSDEEGWLEFARTHSPVDRAALAREVERFLIDHSKDPHAAFKREFRPDLFLVADDEEMVGWLKGAATTILCFRPDAPQ